MLETFFFKLCYLISAKVNDKNLVFVLLYNQPIPQATDFASVREACSVCKCMSVSSLILEKD